MIVNNIDIEASHGESIEDVIQFCMRFFLSDDTDKNATLTLHNFNGVTMAITFNDSSKSIRSRYFEEHEKLSKQPDDVNLLNKSRI